MSVVTHGDVVWAKMADSGWERSVAPAGQATGLEQFTGVNEPVKLPQPRA